MSDPKGVTVTLTFDSIDAALDFLSPPMVVNVLSDPPLGASERPDPVPVPEKRARKPRSDAGQPRGPYKKGDEPATAPEASTPAPESAPAVAAPAPTKLTLADVRAAMEKLNKAKNGGIDANIRLLRTFGVAKASELPEEKFAEFIAAVLKAAAV